MLDDAALLKRLQEGDEMSFTWLVEQYHPALVRLARLYVREEAVAEELAQETWLAALQSLNRFEGRSSLKTWIFPVAGQVISMERIAVAWPRPISCCRLEPPKLPPVLIVA